MLKIRFNKHNRGCMMNTSQRKYLVNKLKNYLASSASRSKKKLYKFSVNIRLRDNTCQKCGSRLNLHAHHVLPKCIYTKLKYQLDNGITLCSECHNIYHEKYGFYKEVNPLSLRAFLNDANEIYNNNEAKKIYCPPGKKNHKKKTKLTNKICDIKNTQCEVCKKHIKGRLYVVEKSRVTINFCKIMCKACTREYSRIFEIKRKNYQLSRPKEEGILKKGKNRVIIKSKSGKTKIVNI